MQLYMRIQNITLDLCFDRFNMEQNQVFKKKKQFFSKKWQKQKNVFCIFYREDSCKNQTFLYQNDQKNKLYQL